MLSSRPVKNIYILMFLLGSYRTFSLLPPISNVFEQPLLFRIRPLVDGIICEEQFGFRAGHSTTLQLVRVLTSLTDAANTFQSTGAVLFAGFDKVWHEGLLLSLIHI